MSSARRVLGRGLADLLPVGGNGAGNAEARPEAGTEAPIATIHPNPGQPRTHFDEDALNELADSIRTNGILQPILVRPRPTGGYEIVAGERRYRAALRAGLKSVPVVIRALSDEDTLAVALIENLIREDIGPMETARAFQRLMADFAWTQEEMARRVGKSRPAVANSLRLLALPEVIQASVERGEISEGHARTLIGDERQRSDPAFRERQLRIWEQIRARSLSVRDAERLMKTDPRAGRSVAGANEPAARCESAADFSALEDRLRDALGTQIRLIGADSRGRIEIEFFSAAELDDLVTKFESLTPGRLSGDRSRSRPGSDRNPAPRSSRNPSE